MVQLSVSTNHGFPLPSETLHLTINHDVAADLDSTNAFEGPEKLLEVWFAPSPAALPNGVPPAGLKAVPSDTWVEMLDMVNCKILSVLESETVDAYLLSESSMFVFPHKLILKTCGTTTLLLGLQHLLHIAAESAGFPFENGSSAKDDRATAVPYRVFYSRKNFLFPDRQQGPHRSWKQEVKYLDDMFEGGSAYMVGKMNGDHWYLYITSPKQMLTPPLTPDSDKSKSMVGKFTASPGMHMRPGLADQADETLEILMTDLDPEGAKQFYLSHASAVACNKYSAGKSHHSKALEGLGELSPPPEEMEADEADVGGGGGSNPALYERLPSPIEGLTTEGHALGTEVSESCGLSNVYPASMYPEARIDAYLFSPCGFSANGVIPSPVAPSEGAREDKEQDKAAHYFTVHVTPEPGFSFASFETNVPGGHSGRTTTEIVEHVVGIFKPGRFSVTFFEAKGRGCNSYGVGNAFSQADLNPPKVADVIHGYRRVDRIVHDFDDYDLVFRFYEREDWGGDKRARVGEVIW